MIHLHRVAASANDLGVSMVADGRRIDFVFAKGMSLSGIDAAIIGEDGPRSGIKVMPWPSDHRAVVAEVTF